MKFYDAVPEVYKRRWSYIGTFTVQLFMPQALDNVCHWSARFGADVDLNVKDISVPQWGMSVFEDVIADRRVIAYDKFDNFAVTITFRDQDQLSLYRTLSRAFVASRKMYADDCACTIVVIKDADYKGESDKKLITFNKCLMTNISQLSFSNETKNQIAEFSVEFACIKPVVHDV